ncbi:hypothetical protein HJG60_011711 [Phyllostomus discolor]|uniref:Uncharacterized protein n=1 Tax=Phyllostomus discolor TaxID=89673 RepID=A0A833ZYK9_9CHIR|nr:hypothetical protein HJG60_011711 [Phyllostomus discolor]
MGMWGGGQAGRPARSQGSWDALEFHPGPSAGTADDHEISEKTGRDACKGKAKLLGTRTHPLGPKEVCRLEERLVPQKSLVPQGSVWLWGPRRLCQGHVQTEGEASRHKMQEPGRAAVQAEPAACLGSFLSGGGLTRNQHPLP